MVRELFMVSRGILPTHYPTLSRVCMNSASNCLLTIDWAIVVVRELSMITVLVGEAEEEPDHLLKKLRYCYHIMITTQ